MAKHREIDTKSKPVYQEGAVSGGESSGTTYLSLIILDVITTTLLATIVGYFADQ